MADLQTLEKEHEAMRDDRRQEEPSWEDIARMVSPDEADFNRDSKGDRDDYDVFDSTPLIALDEFAGGLFGEATNPAERWFELGIADKDLQKWGPVKSWLWNEASLLFSSFGPAVSQFYSESTAWFSNLGRYGNSFVYQEEWRGRQKIIDKAIAAGQAFIRLGPDETLEAFNREFKWTGRQIKAFYGEDACRKCQLEDGKQYQLVHSVYPNREFREGRLGPRGQMFASTTWSPDLKGSKEFRFERGYYEMPFHGTFWNKRAGRTWSTGPGHIARADMNSLNEMERANLIDAQFSAEPMLLTSKEGMFTAADIYPAAILEGTVNEQGKKLAEYLQRGDNPHRAESKTEQVRTRVREAFKFSLMQIINRPQMTFGEFAGWKEERLKSLAPQLTRVHQGLSTVISRRYRLLARAGQTSEIPPELRNQNISIEFVSPLAKAQKLATGRGTMQWVGSLGQLALAAQDPSVMDVVNKDGAARVLHDAMVGIPDVINDQNTVEQIRKGRAEAMAKREGIEQAAQAASIFADAAHASQALSTGRERGRPN